MNSGRTRWTPAWIRPALAAAAAPVAVEVQRAQAQGAPLRAGRPAVGYPGPRAPVERPEVAPRAPEESRRPAARVVKAPPTRQMVVPRIRTDPVVRSARPAAWGKWSNSAPSAAVGPQKRPVRQSLRAVPAPECAPPVTNTVPRTRRPRPAVRKDSGCPERRRVRLLGQRRLHRRLQARHEALQPQQHAGTETCNESGQWIAEAPCQNLCSSGSCAGSCMPGTKRCPG